MLYELLFRKANTLGVPRIILPDFCVAIKAKRNSIFVIICSAVRLRFNMMNLHVVSAKLMANAATTTTCYHCFFFY